MGTVTQREDPTVKGRTNVDRRELERIEREAERMRKKTEAVGNLHRMFDEHKRGKR